MARNFDGSAAHLLNTTALSLTSYPYTLACLVKPDSVAAEQAAIGLGTSQAANQSSFIGISPGGQARMQLRQSSTGSRTWDTTATMSAGTWYSLVGTALSGSACAAFLNGDSTGSYTSTGTQTFFDPDRTCIGARARSTGPSFTVRLDGAIAESALWSVELSQAEIYSLAAGYCPLLVRPQSLVAYWPLHGRAGSGGDEEPWVGTKVLTQTSSPALVDHPRIIYPRRRIWVPKATAATVPTLSASTYKPGTLTADGWQPRVTAS